jgi:hypothetical protein
MPSPRYETLVRDAIAADDMDALLDALLRSSAANSGYTGGVWGEMLSIARDLPESKVESLAAVCATAFPSASAADQAAILVLLATVAPTLPVLVTERQELLEAAGNRSRCHFLRSSNVLAQAELASGRPLTPPVTAVFRRSAAETYGSDDIAAVAKQLRSPVLNVGEQWAERAMDSLTPPWEELLAFACTATAAKPNAKWEKAGRALLAEIGDRFEDTVLPWLGLVGRPRTFPLERAEYEHDVNNAYDPFNANAVRGLVWLLSFRPAQSATARVLGALVETSLRKVDGLGPRNPKVANAAVYALRRLSGDAVLAELARLATRVTFKGTLKLIDAALEEKAKALGLSREEIEELAVPAYGLTSVGHAEIPFGTASASVTVVGAKAVLGWFAGKPVKSVPAVVKRDHAEELKELKATVKDIDKMLTAQVERLDRQFLARRTWDFPSWRDRYLDHPLVGTIARRLLWMVDGVACGYADGALRDLADNPVTGSVVELWHPIGRSTAEIVAWRDWLERHGITQPFKQAHREVYLLTDAERRTGDYSNRFAAHVLRQHQFHSLAAVRGWRNKLLLCVDDSAPPPIRALPQWGLRAEFWVEGDGLEWGTDTTESGSYLRLRTDQVRFYPLDAPENWASCYGGGFTGTGNPLPLSEVPELVLSEVLRDVDLFVGVASVGNDPTWQDGGPGGRFADYWATYSFGELNQSAETRRDLLSRLLPRLAIGGQCTVEGRFLHVKGTRHTYQIHLGSGNILIAPDNRYLCIVASSGTTTPDSYLPFDGDRVLSVILSKALLLAKDTEITDPTILSQL